GDSRGDALCVERCGRGAAVARGAPGAHGVEHARADGGTEPLVRAGAVAPSAAAGGGKAAQAALRHPGESTPAHVPDFRHACGTASRGLPALSGEQPARDVLAAGNADTPASARHEQSLRGQLILPPVDSWGILDSLMERRYAPAPAGGPRTRRRAGARSLQAE